VLSADCLVCHGNPANCPASDGKDMLGFRMEAWHEGDQHCMFLLRSKLDRVDAVVQAGMGQAVLWLLPLSIGVGLGVYFLISRISNRLLTLTQSISGGSAEVTAVVAQIAASSQALAQGASEQAASLEETSSATTQITGMTRKNAENSQLAAEEMERVSHQIRDSNTTLSEMVACIRTSRTPAARSPESSK
jgi:methyl-accepting chemotaxis protein